MSENSYIKIVEGETPIPYEVKGNQIEISCLLSLEREQR